MPGSCGLISGPASSMAEAGLQGIRGYADASVNRVIASSESLQDLIDRVSPLTTDIQLDDTGVLSSPFAQPTKPKRPKLTVTIPDIEYDPSLATVRFTSTVNAPPEFTKSAPGLNFGTKPTPVTYPEPGNAPTVVERTMPPAPTETTIPPVPDLEGIKIPTMLELSLPTFEGVLPPDLYIGEIPTFSWTETPYTPENQTEMSIQIKAILGGSTGIPDGIWDAIWERTRRQLSAQHLDRVETITEEFCSQGHMLPTGAERKRTKEASFWLSDQVADTAREQAIQDARITVERLNMALSQGVALEGLLINLHNQQAERSLRVAQLIVQISIEAANLKVTVYNARMGAYATQAQVFVSIMQGELAKLEKFKAELEAQKLIGTLNLQTLEVYKTRIQALETTFVLYSEQVKAVIAQYDGDKTRVQAYAETVKAFGEVHKAKETEWRGYGESVKAEGLKLDAFKVEADAHFSRMQGYEIGTRADSAILEGEIASETLKLEKMKTFLDKLRLHFEGEKERISALARVYEADSSMYRADGDIERSRVTSDTTRFGVLVQNADTKAQVEFRNLEREMTHAERLMDQQVNGFTNIMSVNGQVASSALAALNYSATISDSISNSTSCSTSFEG